MMFRIQFIKSSRNTVYTEGFKVYIFFNFFLHSLLLSGSGSESSHESMINKKTKTKKERYLDNKCLHTNTLR